MLFCGFANDYRIFFTRMVRAKLYGWPNTYVFTKAMAEVYLEHSKGNLPVTIIRPAVVTSTYKEPFPGWIQSFR